MQCSYCNREEHRIAIDWEDDENGIAQAQHFIQIHIEPDDLLEWICTECQNSYQAIIKRQQIRKERGVIVKSVGAVFLKPASILATLAI